MAIWGKEEIAGAHSDFRWVRNGFVNPVADSAEFKQSLERLERRGYHVVNFDAGSWADHADFHADFNVKLHFPHYYGSNLDALNDCLRDVADGEYGWPKTATGIALAFANFSVFEELHPNTAAALRNIISEQGRRAALFGNRFFALLQAEH